MFWSCQPVAPWQTAAWLAEMRRTLRPAAYLRQIENRFVSTESTFIDMGWWDACVDPAATPLVADRSIAVHVGVDASVKHDSTAIVAVCWDEQAKKARLIWHRIYQPSADEPLDFEATVEDAVLDLHRRFDVRSVRYDPYQMHAVAQRLRREGVQMEEFPQSVPNLTEASQNLYELIQGRNLVSYPNEAIRLAVSRAIAVETTRGWRISKDKQSHKIDVVVAMAMAALGAVKNQSVYDSSLQWVRGPSAGERERRGQPTMSMLTRSTWGHVLGRLPW
jgi:phage terminase large subunit-like protein